MDSDICALCGQATEDREHLFMQCSVTTQVFQHFSSCLPFLSLNLSFNDAIHLFSNSSRKTSSLFVIRAMLYNSILAGIWRLRNGVIFQNKVVDVQQVVREVCIELSLSLGYPVEKLNRNKKQVLFQLQHILAGL